MRRLAHNARHAYRTLRDLPERERAAYFAAILVVFCLLFIVLIDHDMRRAALETRSALIHENAALPAVYPIQGAGQPSVRENVDASQTAVLVQKLMNETSELRAKVQELDAKLSALVHFVGQSAE